MKVEEQKWELWVSAWISGRKNNSLKTLTILMDTTSYRRRHSWLIQTAANFQGQIDSRPSKFFVPAVQDLISLHSRRKESKYKEVGAWGRNNRPRTIRPALWRPGRVKIDILDRNDRLWLYWLSWGEKVTEERCRMKVHAGLEKGRRRDDISPIN